MTREREMILAASFMLAHAGCKEPVLTAAVPDAVEYVALLVRGDQGAIISASRLAAWPKGQGRPIIAPDGGEIILAGWTASAVDGAAIGEQPLEVAAACDPALASPAWTARWNESDVLEPLPPSELPPLTAPWLRDRCAPFEDAELAIDVGCGDVRCEPLRQRVSPCRVDLDLSQCGLGVVHTTVHAGGRLCASFEDVGLRCEPATSAGAACEAPSGLCPIEAHLTPRVAPWTASRIALFPVEPFVPDWLSFSEELRPKSPSFGYGRDLVVLAERVVIASALDPLPCPVGQETSRFDLLDLSGTRTSTRAAPSCISRLARDPAGSGFFAFFTDQNAWWLGRFSKEAELLTSTPVPSPVNAHEWTPISSVTSSTGGELHVLFGPSEVAGAENGAALLVSFDVETLAQRMVPITHERCWSVTVLGPERLAIACSDRRELVFLSMPSGAEELSVMLPRQDSRGRDSLLEVALHAPSDRLLVSASRSSFVYVVGAASRVLQSYALIYERDATPVRSYTWPLDPSKVFVASIARASDGSWIALGALFDPVSGRYDPGVFELGPGIPSRADADAAGALWVLLPWSAEVVHLAPRSGP